MSKEHVQVNAIEMLSQHFCFLAGGSSSSKRANRNSLSLSARIPMYCEQWFSLLHPSLR